MCVAKHGAICLGWMLHVFTQPVQPNSILQILQVQKLQQLWRSAVIVRKHQRQLLFMQLRRFADRQAARTMRTGAAFLSGATFSATANTAKKGTLLCDLPVGKASVPEAQQD